MVVGLFWSTLAAAAPVGVRKQDDLRAKMVEARLKGGFPIMAAEMARTCIEESPDNHACREVLGRALALSGRCDAALEELNVLRYSEHWGFQPAISEGTCLVRTGRLHEAIAAFEEAARYKPNNHGPALQLGLVYARLGWIDAVDDAIVMAEEAESELWVTDLLSLWRAWAAGDPAIDDQLHHFRRWQEGGSERTLLLHASLLDCYRALQLGEVDRAEEAADLGLRVARGHNRVQSCRAEAIRRRGDAGQAVYLLTRPWQTAKKAPILDAVLARAYVDDGDLDAAEDLLNAVPNHDDPDVLASWWYLHRARGDAEAAAKAAALYDQRVVPSTLDLHDLVPIPER